MSNSCTVEGVVTITTVGYGDVHPITPLGRILASVIAPRSIMAVFMPVGIIASGFVEEVHKKRSDTQHCPSDPTERIHLSERLASLGRSGTLTEDEFAQQKRTILAHCVYSRDPADDSVGTEKSNLEPNPMDKT